MQTRSKVLRAARSRADMKKPGSQAGHLCKLRSLNSFEYFVGGSLSLLQLLKQSI
jgi:hypothetical protein